MGQLWEVPRDVDVYARVEMVAILERQPTASRVVSPTKWVARADVEIKQERFAVVAYEDNAKRLAACAGGTVLAIKGWLTHPGWKTGDGKAKGKFEIEISELSILGRTEKYKPRPSIYTVKYWNDSRPLLCPIETPS